ncbi:uncharacterized protein MONBRDRAFT_33756 [Monosiga brevicollis MX1]|uniref:Cytosolic Fe-S cluster assembly factor NUBP2 homolog n=1 Tax=Monosiga brevicollis TaxID=81824 RepID=NUBP2_MONBE|nr:uncharacterized protein MONBRDRAFT_33756 [Monosiga brevicollis MX1]A9V7A1.1 RecName: Full=Cytosolic Fe-S cluster assembly factor NUBP2 homolog [Monosiga brevicollis]EDQ86547.1 predicted protein [Monosiga brevicollis MX1]|eukprot:XP_001748660.1 hypothetical protein [Monosiga brevicollis MX1]
MAAPNEFYETLKQRLAGVKHIVLVLSGKGGVGKSTVASQMAIGLIHRGLKVGLLDIDLTGPSIPTMFGVADQQVHTSSEGWVPLYKYDQRLAIMSIGFLLDSRDEAVIWRGPKKNAMIQQFLSEVCWDELDCLVVDTPPGTSDEHLSIVDALKLCKPDGAILVTTPQGVALSDVRREAEFCRKARLKVLGVVENMSGFACPHCKDCTNLFSKGGGEKLAQEIAAPFLGAIPIDPMLGQSLSRGEDFLASCQAAPSYEAVAALIDPLMAQLGLVQATADTSTPSH